MKKSLEKDGGKQSIKMLRLNQKAFPGRGAFKKHEVRKKDPQRKITQKDCKDLEESGFEC